MNWERPETRPVHGLSAAANPWPILSRAGETGGGGIGSPRAPEISSLERDRRGPDIFIKWALLTDIVLFFLGSLLFLHTLCGPFWRLGPFSVRAPRSGPPDTIDTYWLVCTSEDISQRSAPP